MRRPGVHLCPSPAHQGQGWPSGQSLRIPVPLASFKDAEGGLASALCRRWLPSHQGSGKVLWEKQCPNHELPSMLH